VPPLPVPPALLVPLSPPQATRARARVRVMIKAVNFFHVLFSSYFLAGIGKLPEIRRFLLFYYKTTEKS
jgi:hypothetical protein